MAISNWKKVKSTKEQTIFVNNKTGNVVDVYYKNYESAMRDKGWQIDVGALGNSLVVKKNPKNKPEALRYAKDYMRRME